MTLDDLQKICDAPTPIKFSKCPECGTSKQPTWTERYSGGDSQCSECKKVSYNWRWIAFTDGVSDEQFLKVARTEMPKLIELIQKLEAALKIARRNIHHGELQHELAGDDDFSTFVERCPACAALREIDALLADGNKEDRK